MIVIIVIIRAEDSEQVTDKLKLIFISAVTSGFVRSVNLNPV